MSSPLESPPDGAGDPQAFYGYWVMKKNTEWHVLNFGVNGERTDQIRDRLDAALASHPAYVILLAGVNDVYQGVDSKTTTINLGGMYREIQRQNSVPVVASILPFDRATSAQAATIRQLNDWIQSTAEKFKIPFVDLNKVVRDPGNPDHLNGSPDGLHPDVGAYRQMGAAISKTLQDLEKSH